MEFTQTPLLGAWLVDLHRHNDERGFFARAFCQREFTEHRITPDVRQMNISLSTSAGTLRGLHFQYPPAAESKVVRCISGAIFDVIVDLRPESATFLRHTSAQLDAVNRTALVIPPRFAHGFITLTDDAEVLYLHSEFHASAAEGGLAFDDPDLGIEWPMAPSVLSERDSNWPPLSGSRGEIEQRMQHPSTPLRGQGGQR